eukprot:CAMPEP_0118980100 /NCGR_PEP_ID=MMETSP1173-20130426/27536_1 /TAXON_ID=1034831 /ORGANISM="Rhizochromulina marina cf, Strain CCMP1243" /LENGTH=85 /DNA_ID=CAMNT_0006930421 /DNA_START=121 /DNA_END=378 /DNA_ORIENTATION=+
MLTVMRVILHALLAPSPCQLERVSSSRMTLSEHRSLAPPHPVSLLSVHAQSDLASPVWTLHLQEEYQRQHAASAARSRARLHPCA